MALSLILVAAVVLLALSNGANDNFKGVATLFGSRTVGYWTALAWATVTTAAGSLAAIALAEALLKRFSGKGLVPDALATTEPYLVAIVAGAALTVVIASLLGLPISTTHALTGAMIGSGWMAVGRAVNLGALGKTVVLPLLLSPVLAVGLGAGLYLALRALRRSLGIARAEDSCVCVEETAVAVFAPDGAMALQATAPAGLRLRVAHKADCKGRYTGRIAGLSGQRLVDVAQFISAGVVSFARGLNDTPKIAAVLLASPLLGPTGSLVLVAAAMAIGGVVGARRVAETMSHKVTQMSPGQGLSASLSTGALVLAASAAGLPVSTTHVSVGSLVGIGLSNRKADFSVIRTILLSWIATLPIAAVLSAAVYAAAPQTKPDTTKWIPAVRTRAWLATSEARLKQAAVPHEKGLGVVTPLNAALVWLVAEDRPGETRFVTVDEIAAAGLSADQAKQTALENLRRIRPQMPLEGKNGRFRVVGERQFEASLALDEAWMRDKTLGLQGDPVVAVPSTTMIFITDTSNAAALLSLRGVVSRLFGEAGSSALSPELFTWRHGQLEILPVP